MTAASALSQSAPATPSLPEATSSSLPSRIVTILLVIPAAVLLLTPFGIVAAAAAAEPDVLLILADKPMVGVQLALGLMTSLLFCTLPFRRFSARPLGREVRSGKE